MKKPFSWLSKPGASKATHEDYVVPGSSGSIPAHLADRLRRGGVNVDVKKIDPQEKARIRALLSQKMDSGMTGVELGRFIVPHLQGKDQGLSNIITQMALHQFTYAEIAIATLELVGLLTHGEDFAAVPRQPIMGGDRRFYSNSNTQAITTVSPVQLPSGQARTQGIQARAPYLRVFSTIHLPGHGGIRQRHLQFVKCPLGRPLVRTLRFFALPPLNGLSEVTQVKRPGVTPAESQNFTEK
ncbi:predicted protein [Uncinocarpus reesii 1704]|uniref:Uncharacterized protein n=1 Tax=Uncinocarpus reesii (strain UAMH 1704) TaxID=336963 RepID=C4JHS5_UNCRE|nr:uncharacterized protein UREG_02761 [Uncinocarpus reesii 1704]EEP77912.1 predicted protein [Uncinocarpus reesii 1704]